MIGYKIKSRIALTVEFVIEDECERDEDGNVFDEDNAIETALDKTHELAYKIEKLDKGINIELIDEFGDVEVEELEYEDYNYSMKDRL